MRAIIRDSRQDDEDAEQEAEEAEALFIDSLVRAGGAGWANDPSGAGSVLVERATGCVFLSSDGNPIRSTVRIKFPSADRIDKSKFRAHVDFFEGVVQYMYLDSEGNVTVGIGHLIKDAAEAERLGFYRRDSKANPHPIHVKNAFDKVRRNKQKAKFGASAFKDLTHLDLDFSDIEEIFENDVSKAISQLKSLFPEFFTYPGLVQLGMLDLGYNMGVQHFFNEFKVFRAALKIRNWATVAAQSRRTEVDAKNNLLESVRDRNNIVQGWFLFAINEEPFYINPDCRPKPFPKG